MKLSVVLGSALALTMAVGIGSGVAINSQSKQVQAAGGTEAEHTVYLAIDANYIADKVLKVETNIGDGGALRLSEAFTDISDSNTFEGKKVFQGEFTEKYGGADQFFVHIFSNSGDWIQKREINSDLKGSAGWCTTDYYENKVMNLFLENDNLTWASASAYSPVEIKKYAKIDSASPVLIATEHINSGSSLAIPKGKFINNKKFLGWYNDATCSTDPYDVPETITSLKNLYGKYTTVSGFSGTTIIDLKETTDFTSAAAKYAIHYYNETQYETTLEGWSEHLISVAAGQRLINFTYALDFEPNMMQLVRYNPLYTEDQWIANRWPGDPYAWGETQGASIHPMGNVYKDGYVYKIYGFEPAEVMEGVSGGAMSCVATLDHAKIQTIESHYYEMYSENVSLTTGKYFKIHEPTSDIWRGRYTCHPSLVNNFGRDQGDGDDDDIKIIVGGTYALFYDFRDDQNYRTVYITTVELAEADQWAETFLAGVTCSGQSGTILTDNWSTLDGTYTSMVATYPGVQTIFAQIASGGKEDGTAAEQAVARYDFILRKYGIGTGAGQHTDFMGRFSLGGVNYNSLPSSPVNTTSAGNTTPIILVVVIATVSLSAIGGYLLIKRRKAN